MLHLDRNHTSPLSPHTKPNLILSDTPQADQPALLSWAVPPTDDGSFAFDGKDQSPPDTLQSPPKPQPALSAPEQPQTQPTQSEDKQQQQQQPPTDDTDTSEPPPPTPPPPVAPADADEPKPDPVPSSPVDATSPAPESTSSLTPPPDSTSPAFPSAALPDQEPPTQPKLEQSDGEQRPKTDDDKSAEVDKASRASTPLSELSSAPDGDDPPDAEKRDEKGDPPPSTEGAHEAGGSKTGAGTAGQEAKVDGDAKPKNGHVDPPQSSSNPGHPPDPNHRQGSHDIVPKAETPSDADSQAHHLATPEPVSTTSARSPSKLDPRVVAVLELNAHLLKVSMEFQSRNVPLSDPMFQQYAQRLQSNLAWLAATADATRKLNHNNMPFPVMQPPPSVDFVAMERILQLYTELPNLFAKDIMRRQSLLGANAAAHIPGGPNGHLKRDRPDEPPGEIPNKRRDTGESKQSTPGPGTPSHHSPTHSVVNSMGHPATPPHNGPMQGMPGQPMGSPAMPPPAMNPGMLQGDAQAIMAQRAARMRASMQDGQRQAQQMGAPGQPGMSMQNMAGPSGMQGNQQGMGQTMSNDAVMQSLQILQNPSHPWTRYLINQLPGFQSLPVQTQLQHVQKMGLLIQARNQAKNAQQHHGNSMQGFPQGQQNGGMPGQMGIPNGSPTRLSAQQQSPMPPQGSFPFANQGGMDPRAAAAGLGGGNVPLDPQRRQQLLLMQQQNMMRSNAMFNNQQQQQRLAQQQAAAAAAAGGGQPHLGSPMLGGSPDGLSFPALRSNPSVPGIARSTRTPSDHAPSPLTPQLSGGAQDLQRAMMQQAQQQQQQQRGVNMNMLQHGQSHGMGQMGLGGMNVNVNPGWPQQQQQQQGQQQYAMTPPGSAGFGSMPGGRGSPVGGGQQQWQQQQGGGASFAFNAGSPSGQPEVGPGPGSRQTSATPAPHQQQQQMMQNNPMGDQAGLNVDFNDMFTWGQ